MDEVLDARVRSREEQALVAVVAPTNEPWRTAVLAPNLQDLRISITLTNVMALDDESIANCCAHREPPSSCVSTHQTTNPAPILRGKRHNSAARVC